MIKKILIKFKISKLYKKLKSQSYLMKNLTLFILLQINYQS